MIEFILIILIILLGPIWGWYLYATGDSIPAQSLSPEVLIFASLSVVIPGVLAYLKKSKNFAISVVLIWIFWGVIFGIAIWA